MIHKVDPAALSEAGTAPEPGEFGIDWAGRVHEWQPSAGGWVLVGPSRTEPRTEPHVEPLTWEWQAEAGG